MALDNERCEVSGCTLHRGWRRVTPGKKRDAQILEDWASGEWSVDELSSFWGLTPLRIMAITRGADDSQAQSEAPLEVSHS